MVAHGEVELEVVGAVVADAVAVHHRVELRDRAAALGGGVVLTVIRARTEKQYNIIGTRENESGTIKARHLHLGGEVAARQGQLAGVGGAEGLRAAVAADDALAAGERGGDLNGGHLAVGVGELVRVGVTYVNGWKD